MEIPGKVILKATLDLEKFYAFLAQVLRVVIDPDANNGISEDLFNEQLDKVRKDLEEILSKNHVVQKNLSEIDQNVMKIREAASDKTRRKRAIEDAQRYLPTLEERSRTVSDLVALFRQL